MKKGVKRENELELGEQHLGKSSWVFCFLFCNNKRMFAITAIMRCKFPGRLPRIIFDKSPFLVVSKVKKRKRIGG